MKPLFLFLIVWLPLSAIGQFSIRGRVVDEKTNEGLAFVNIVATRNSAGTTSDIDGNFELVSQKPVDRIQVSYVGYKFQEIDVFNTTSILIRLKRTSYQLQEFNVLPGVNPANRIINKVIENRKKHNPEKSLDFKYTTYNKTYFTASIDSSILYNPEKIAELDSSDQEMIAWLEDQHVMLMESVTERKFKRPDKSYEKIIASRVSGLKNSTLSLLATEIQSLSFYNPLLNVLDRSYLNPISVNSINKYLFLIEDTTFLDKDTVYIISFRPNKGKNFDGLMGLLYVNTGGFALQNVIAEPANQDEEIWVKIQQKYEKIDEHWFPTQLNSNFIFNNLLVENYKLMGIGKTYIKNIQINPKIDKKEFSNIAIDLDDDILKREDDFWNQYRIDTLSQKEKSTYRVIDSIGEVENLDKWVNGLEAFFGGKLNWGVIDLDLNRFINYNDYEGFRLGGGISTNKKISKWFTLGAYGAYGFKDKSFKYGGNADFRIDRRGDINFSLSAIHDVEEPGVVNYSSYKAPILSAAGFRTLYLSRMNKLDRVEARLGFRTFRYLKVSGFINKSTVEVTNNYFFKKLIEPGTVLHDNYYHFSEVGAEFRYAFKEKITKTLNSKITRSTRYPILYAKVEQGIKPFNGEYVYTRLSLKTEKKFRIKSLGQLGFQLSSGLTRGKVPHHKLNNPIGTSQLNSFALASENVFETMIPYEFFSSEYVHLHLRHSFGSLLLKVKKFEPEFILSSSIGFGSLSYSGLHAGESFKTMEKGYYESGILINNILKLNFYSLGLGTFFRYGPYRLPKFSHNLTFKMTFGITL